MLTKALTAAVAVLLAAALGGPLPASGADDAPTVTAASEDVSFTPDTITIHVGESVKFQHAAGSIPHNVKFDKGSFKQPSDPTTDAWSFDRTFSAAGTFRFYCEAHGAPGGVGMAGKVIVLAPGQSAPDTTRPVVSAAKPLLASFGKSASVRIAVKVSEASTLNGTIARKSGTGAYRSFGSYRKFLKAGVNTVDATRTKTGRRLTPGSYRLIFTALDKAGNRSASRRVSWTVRSK